MSFTRAALGFDSACLVVDSEVQTKNEVNTNPHILYAQEITRIKQKITEFAMKANLKKIPHVKLKRYGYYKFNKKYT